MVSVPEGGLNLMVVPPAAFPPNTENVSIVKKSWKNTGNVSIVRKSWKNTGNIRSQNVRMSA